MQQSKELQGFAMPEFFQAIASCAVTSHYRRGAAICHARDPAEYWYRVAAGMAARSVTFSDGRRQIIELLFRGDFFGFTCSSFHQVDVEAVTDGTTIIRYPRRSVDALVESNPKLESQLRQLAFDAIRRLDDRIVWLGRTDALEKVGAFLTEMAERVPRGPGDRIALPLSRYQIADYLGLSMETVRNVSSRMGQATREIYVGSSAGCAMWRVG